MMSSLRRTCIGLLVAIPLVVAGTALLLSLPHVVSFVVTLAGVAALAASEASHSKIAAAAGGLLTMSGILAWALVAAQLVGTAS